MNIYKVVDNKLDEKKQLNKGYELQVNEFEGVVDGTVGQVLINGSWVDDPVEVANNAKSARIQELKMAITNKKLLDMDCVAEQTELKTLLGL